jgi:hypothetical protein
MYIKIFISPIRVVKTKLRVRKRPGAVLSAGSLYRAYAALL